MKTILRSDELSCPTCVDNIESMLNGKEGVTAASVHFNTGRIEVEHDPEKVSESDLLKAVENSGYEAKISEF